MLFLLPIGGGIPAGVVLGNARGLSWEIMMLLYFFSDVVLACAFDPLMKLFIHYGKRSPAIAKLNAQLKKSYEMTTSQYGVKPRPHVLVLISFGVDPMTGRAATYIAGHGFFAGWAMAIAGDMIFFTVIMASTLWLNNILGDGTWTAIIITVAVILGPTLFKKLKARFTRTS
ncbi:MAG: hypothetical protein ACXVAX_06480 [Pseudobdellovibrio sp.]